jgi:hypothetical protein
VDDSFREDSKYGLLEKEGHHSGGLLCMCKKCEELGYHLFLHCKVARDMWELIFRRLRMEWVMPQ